MRPLNEDLTFKEVLKLATYAWLRSQGSEDGKAWTTIIAGRRTENLLCHRKSQLEG